MVGLLHKVTILLQKTVPSFSVEWFNFHSHRFPLVVTAGHSSEVCDFVKLLACRSRSLEFTFVQSNSQQVSQSNMVLWSVNWYFLIIILLTIQVTISNCNPSAYPGLISYVPPTLSLKISNVFDSLQQANDFSWLPCSLSPYCKCIMSTACLLQPVLQVTVCPPRCEDSGAH